LLALKVFRFGKLSKQAQKPEKQKAAQRFSRRLLLQTPRLSAFPGVFLSLHAIQDISKQD
jgi:hypothetical protein